jgi:hypothetical protein
MVVGAEVEHEGDDEIGRGKWRPGKKEGRMTMMMGGCSISALLDCC